MFGPSLFEVLLLFLILLTPVIIIVFAFIVFAYKRKQQKASLKGCPFCAELIKREAVVCRYCQREIAI